MTDKERLEEIKYILNSPGEVFFGSISEDGVVSQDVADAEPYFNWLIEQAQRVQELEDIIYQDERQGMIEDLYEENKRYREALELLNKVSASDMKDEQFTSSHFVLDITGDALREG